MILAQTRDVTWMRWSQAVLDSATVPSRWEPHPQGGYSLDVPASSAALASQLLSEQFREQLLSIAEQPPTPIQKDSRPLLLQPAFAGAFSAALLILIFAWFGGVGSGPWFREGAFIDVLVIDGQVWRYVTAATLHADWPHAIGNAVFLTILGWGVAERVGVGTMAFLWLITAVGGFYASLLGSEAVITVGASGGIFGLLGFLGGHQEIIRGRGLRGRYRSVAAVIMLLAFTAFGPKSNIAAHIGGFAIGLVLGIAFRGRRAPPGWVQLFLGLLTFSVVAAAWSAAKVT